MGMLAEFKQFAVKGNAIDMAVGIIIGSAFTPIVKSLVDDVIMPPLGVLIGDVDFSEYKLTLKEAVTAADETVSPAVAINYGQFVTLLITFVIIAFAVFLLVKGMNRLREKEPLPPPAPTEKSCPQCLMTIPLAATRCGHCTSAL